MTSTQPQCVASELARLPRDVWRINPSRLSLCCFAVLYFCFLALLFLLWFYAQRTMWELALAVILMCFVLPRDYASIRQSRIVYQLCYLGGRWRLSIDDYVDTNSEHLKENESGVGSGDYLEWWLVTARTPLFICLKASGLENPETAKTLLGKSRLLIWRDQMPYCQWRLLHSRLAAQ